MDIKDLRHFVAVYEAKGFSRASRALGTVQSNVSGRIRGLEKFLGVRLFQRRYRCIVPTDEGNAFYEHAKRVIGSLDDAERAIRLSAEASDETVENVTSSRGFTLLELLVVIVIIGLLAGFVAPRYFSQVGKSEIEVARAQIDAFEKALDQYRLDTRRYPDASQGLTALVERPTNEPRWNGPYLRKSVPLDPWGRPYVYKVPGTKSDFDLVSYGRDGRPGGTGNDADITNN